MKKAILFLTTLSIIFLLVSLYKVLQNFYHFFPSKLEQVAGVFIATYLTVIYIDEAIQIITKKSRINLNRFVFSMILVIFCLCWIIRQYIIEIASDNIFGADSLFTVLICILTFQFFSLIKYSFSAKDFKSLRSCLEIE